MKLPPGKKLIWLIPLAIAALFLVAAVVALVTARGSADKGLTRVLKPGEPGTKTLIVLVHGYAAAGNIEAMDGVRKAALQAQPGADVLMFGYAAQTFSNANPFDLANQMSTRIEELQATQKYERIFLCGYSMGALLIRKAYVYGCGSIADSPLADGRQTKGPRLNWVDHVDRFVLLAGMNRGFSLDAVPENSTLARRLLYRFGLRVAKLTGTGRLPEQCMRGAPFVANLRLQWLDVMHQSERAGGTFPTAIQLLGSKDDIVAKSDSRDVTVARGFIWVPVNNTSHAEMIKFGDSGSALERREKVTLAFGNEETLAELRRLSPTIDLEQDDHVKTVVFVLHGIRDMGEWTSQFTIPLQKAFAEKNSDKEAKLYVHPASYGYFPMGPFLLFGDRQKNVRWFMDEVTDLVARFPNLEELHFIGHSNGTYVVASALEKYQALKVNRAVLAGCVLRRDYKWSERTGRVGRVRNYVGADDWVVGLAPKLFELPLFKLLNKDIGSAGFDGFTDGFLRGMETYYVKEGPRGGHAAALEPDNVASIVDFIINERVTETPTRQIDAHPGMLAFWSSLCWIPWVVVVALILVIGWRLPYLLKWIARKFTPARPVSFRAFKWICRCGYAAVIWLLLNTY
jgi:pimeloyl-ACP methyl ester carboxylesterase